MRRKLTPALKLALRTNVEAIKANLMEFHGKTPAQANALVKPLETDASEMALHEEPYVTAFELVRGDEVLPIELYREHRTKAVELWEMARAQVMAGNRPAPDFKKLLIKRGLAGSRYAPGKSGKPGKLVLGKVASASLRKAGRRKQVSAQVAQR